MTKRRRQKIRQKIMTNLTYARMQGDLLAIEAAIRDNDAKAKEEERTAAESMQEMSLWRKFWNGVKTEISNSLKRISAIELADKRERAKMELDTFKSAHSKKELRLGSDPEALKKYMEKMLFKKDGDGRGRLAFALIYAIDDKHGYQFPAESLEFVSEIFFDDPKRLGVLYSQFTENYICLNRNSFNDFERGLGIGIGLGGLSAFSVLPAAISGAVAFINYVLGVANAGEECEKLTSGEAYTTLAFGLTLIEASKGKVSDEAMREMIDEELSHISNIRSDAEYTWTAEKDAVEECREKIEMCDKAFKRLTEIIAA